MSYHRANTYARTLADVATGAAAALVIFGAVPGTLLGLVGLPFPRHLDRAAVLSTHGLYDVLALISWVAWAACCAPLLRSVATRIRHRDTTTGASAHFSDRLAAKIAAAVVALTPTGVFLANGAGAATPAGSPVVSAPAAAAVPTPVVPANDQLDLIATQYQHQQYKVTAGDSLWSIAELVYQDGSDWQLLAAANLGHLMPDGLRFVDPSMIEPGWVLAVPDPAGSIPIAPTFPTPVPSPASLRSPTSPPSSAAGVTPAPAPLSPIVLARLSATHVPDNRPAPDPRPFPLRHPEPALPELAALGLGAIAAAALARSARRRRMAAVPRAETPEPFAEMASEEDWSNERGLHSLGTDMITLASRLIDTPALDWFELANRHLHWATRGEPADRIPGIRLIRVGTYGVDFWLSEATAWAPRRWEVGGDGWIWRLPTTHDLGELEDEAHTAPPRLPVVVTVGNNEDGTWLVPLARGACLPVVGFEARRLVAAMRIAASSWSWSEQIVVTDDPDVVLYQAASGEADPYQAASGEADPAIASKPVLFFGDPTDLGPASALCSTVTDRPLRATNLTIAVDAHSASLLPVGVSLRADGLSEADAAAIDALLSFERHPVSRGPRTPHPSSQEPVELPLPSADALAPGTAEVRLLTPLPRIDGLCNPLHPKRARRATELVAYLALHAPEAVTGERLRTRVLGSADADAAAKTLFNTVSDARRALGNDHEGQALLPPAVKPGSYRISSEVTVDVQRAQGLVMAARAESHPAQTMALLRAALELIEGEPLTAVMAGYSWWEPEGHGARVATMLTEAACRLAVLATDHGHDQLAMWAIGQGRYVDPYSEDLAAAALRVAARTAGADGLRREWREHRRRLAELSPDIRPSTATERLYHQLAEQRPPQANLAAMDAAPRRTNPSAPAAL